MNLYRHSVQVQQKSTSQTSFGTSDPDYSERIATLKCLLQKKSVRVADEFGKITYRDIVRMYIDINTSIDKTDRVVAANAGTTVTYAGTYEILGIKDAGGQGRIMEIDMELVT